MHRLTLAALAALGCPLLLPGCRDVEAELRAMQINASWMCATD